MSDEFDDSSYDDVDYSDADYDDSGYDEADYDETDFEESDFEETGSEGTDSEESEEIDDGGEWAEDSIDEGEDFQEEAGEEAGWEEDTESLTEAEESGDEMETEESEWEEDTAEEEAEAEVGEASETEDMPEEAEEQEAEVEEEPELSEEEAGWEEETTDAETETAEISGQEDETRDTAEELLRELDETEETGTSDTTEELLGELDETEEAAETETDTDDIEPEDAERYERMEAALQDLNEGYENAFQMNADLMEDISNDPALTAEQKQQLLSELEQDTQRMAEEKKAYTQDIISGKISSGESSDEDVKVLKLSYAEPEQETPVYEETVELEIPSDTGPVQKDLNSIQDKFDAFFRKGIEDTPVRDMYPDAMDRAAEHAQEMIDDYCRTELGNVLSDEKQSLRLRDTSEFQNENDFAAGLGGVERARGINGYNDGTRSYIKDSGPHPIKTAIHEHNHQLSCNDVTGAFGLVREYRRGISINGQDTQVNEALTELFTKKIMGADYPENPSVSYIDNMERMETMEEAFGTNILKEAYFQNKPELLRQKFEGAMGSGTWEKFSKAFDDSLKDYDGHDRAIKWAHYQQYGDYNVDTPTDIIRRKAVSEANKYALLFALSTEGGM